MSQIAVTPKPSVRSKPIVVTVILAAVGVVAVGGVAMAVRQLSAGSSVWSAGGGGALTAIPVLAKDFEVRVVSKGEVQAVNNIEVACEVEGINTLTQLIPEGSNVKAGDVLAIVDSSAIRLKLEDGTIELERSKADLTAAQELAEIQKSTNAANIEAAQVALELAQLDLKKYVEGSYPQLDADAKTDLQMAEITLKNKQEDLAQTRSLFSKGFVTATEVKSKELDVTTALNALSKARTALEVLTSYSNVMDLTSKKNALVQAEQKVQRTKRENAANLSKAEADVRAKSQAYEVNKRRIDRLNAQLAACTIKAPADGLVVYNTRDNDRNGGALAEGTEVRERQVLLRLPDISAMKVVTRINEAAVGKLRPGQKAEIRVTNVPYPIPATLSKISVLSDSGSNWMNPGVKEYPVDLVLDYTPDGLKPGVNADASILVDAVGQALTVPLAALYTSGDTRYVFVPAGDGATPAKVKVGRMNEREIEITDGLKPGTSVVLLEAGQGRSLLEKAGIKEAMPTTRPSDQDGPAGDRSRRPKNATPATPANGTASPAPPAPVSPAAAVPSLTTKSNG